MVGDYHIALRPSLTPPERHGARPVGALFHQRLVELAALSAVHLRPALLAIVLQTHHVGAEERRELARAARALALVAHLVVENVRLHLNLQRDGGRSLITTRYPSILTKPRTRTRGASWYKRPVLGQ